MSCQLFYTTKRTKFEYTLSLTHEVLSLTILLSKTADELRLRKETCQQLVLEGANGTDTKFTQRQEISNLEDGERYNLKHIRCGKHQFAKAEGAPARHCQKV